MHKFLLCFSLTASAILFNPAEAMNWCSLPEITPQRLGDFDRIVPKVQSLTGCMRQPSISAHQFHWKCSDQLATSKGKIDTNIYLTRRPSDIGNILIFTRNMTSLGDVRNCELSNLTIGETFVPQNVALRDQGRFGEAGARVTLASFTPDLLSLILTEPAPLEPVSAFERNIWLSAFGLEIAAPPSTRVRIGGIDITTKPVDDVVSGLLARGSVLTFSGIDKEAELDLRTLTAPAGLPGVTQIKIYSALRHTIRVDYKFYSVREYQNMILLLDQEYGSSTRTTVEKCIRRSWVSGTVAIEGSHCQDASTIQFINSTPVIQFLKVEEEREKRLKETPPNVPRIFDRDNF